SSRHSASSVVKRIARALLVLRMERLASVIPMRSASSVRLISRSDITRSRVSLIGMARSDGQLVVALQCQSLAKDFGQREHQKAEIVRRTAERNAAEHRRVVRRRQG